MKGREKILRMSVPDEEVPGWLATLREAGFSQEEIDKIMAHLNDEYAKALGQNPINDKQRIRKQILEETIGRKLTDEEYRSTEDALKNFPGL